MSAVPIPVTKGNYARAETAIIFRTYIKKIIAYQSNHGIGVLMHRKRAMDPNDHTVVRPNFDTLYSFGVFDLTNPAAVTMPDSGRHHILQVINEEHWVPLASDQPGRYELDQPSIGSRYAFILVRTQVNTQDPNDLKAADRSQEKIEVVADKPDHIDIIDQYDLNDLMALRREYNKRRELEQVKPEMMFGKKGEISDEMRNFGVAAGWGGLPKALAVYQIPKAVTSTEPQTLTLNNIPMRPGAFWSVTVYDEEGFATGKSYNINSAFAKKSSNGDFIINFGGPEDQDNHLDIYPGWNAVIRIYSPTKSYFNGTWSTPQFKPKNQ